MKSHSSNQSYLGINEYRFTILLLKFVFQFGSNIHIHHNPLYFVVQSPPKIIKEPPTDELLFQVKSKPSDNDKPFIIECEAEGEPAPS